jgi:catechol 2,3-dioxygenase-like lactoylglutathione lyase family enzyme
MIKGLHHHVYRCRDSEENRRFYEDFLGLPLVRTFRSGKTATGRQVDFLHTTYRLGENSFLEFFEVPAQPFVFKPQHDFDLHLAIEMDHDTQTRLGERARADGMELRGPSDHGPMASLYVRDPNGYVVELTAYKPGRPGEPVTPNRDARATLDSWQATKMRPAGADSTL